MCFHLLPERLSMGGHLSQINRSTVSQARSCNSKTSVTNTSTHVHGTSSVLLKTALSIR